jgi:hypothetical protein
LTNICQEFKLDFYPGENVTIHINNGERFLGVIRDKAKFPGTLNPDGSVQLEAFVRYFVRLINRPDEEALVDAQHMHRDRRHFSKQILRSFLKNSVHREPWTGAPWQVKDELAKHYRIATQVPTHLTYDYIVAHRKTNNDTKRAATNGTTWTIFNANTTLPILKPKSSRGGRGGHHDMARARHEQFIEYQRTEHPGYVNGRGFQPPSDTQNIRFVNHVPGPAFPPMTVVGPPRQQIPPPPKFPIEDLEVHMRHDVPPRVPMSYISEETPNIGRPSEGAGSGIRGLSVGALLETWDTLNVYCEVYVLDSFTFDDYIQALQFTSEESQCELINEIHCAVLKRIVNDEKDLNGKVQINLPIEQEDSDSEVEPTATPTPEPEPEIAIRTTRGSLAKAEAAELKAAAAADAKLHRGAEIDQCVKGYGWRHRLRKRDFANGRWVVIIVGLLTLFTADPRQKKTCDEILIHLAPLGMEATEETAISQYAKLDINLRVKIIQFLCNLTVQTRAIRSYMEDCTLQMTQIRKEKIEAQRNRRAA